ncbi:MAG: hypothetical protein QOH73_1396 [Gaiellaceae bacterium]|nr:hypothetical protein [Gaiellaceae bacterium]
MATPREPVFPLVAQRRITGVSAGAQASNRRGPGSEVATTRPYRRGDNIRTVDWAASARVSAARDADEFIVRDYYADESLRVVTVLDRRPEMALFPAPFPWLDKGKAITAAAALIAGSTAAARGAPGLVDLNDPHDPRWLLPRPRNAAKIRQHVWRGRPFTGPADVLERSFDLLLRARGELPGDTFVFVLSDFVECPADDAWRRLLERRWDVVPVLIQDPRWEQSFPEVGGLALPVVDPRSGAPALLSVSRREARAQRERNERRFAGLRWRFEQLRLDPVLLESAEPADVLAAFTSWAEARRRRLRRSA